MTPRDGLLVLAPLLAGAALVAAVLVTQPPRRVVGEDRYVIPPGTAERVRSGLPVDDVLPQRIVTAVGRRLLVVNQDVVNHVFGPFVLAPGQEWVRQFAVAGDYGIDCSVYPATGFTVAVEAAPVQGGPALAATWAALAAWVLLGALACGGLGVSLVTLGGARARPWLRRVALLLPGAALALVVVNVAALSRLAPWRVVLASSAAMTGLLAVALAAAAALFVTSFLVGESPPAPAALALGGLALLATVAVGLWVNLGWGAVAGALLAAGIGLLGAAVIEAATTRQVGRLGTDPVQQRWLAVVGAALVVAALPWPTGVVLGLLAGTIALVCGLALLALAARGRGRGAPPGAVWLAGGAGLVTTIWAAVVLVASIFRDLWGVNVS